MQKSVDCTPPSPTWFLQGQVPDLPSLRTPMSTVGFADKGFFQLLRIGYLL